MSRYRNNVLMAVMMITMLCIQINPYIQPSIVVVRLNLQPAFHLPDACLVGRYLVVP